MSGSIPGLTRIYGSMIAIDTVVPKTFDAARVTCGFTTRTGGVSRPPFASLNLGARTADDPENIRRNRLTVYSRYGADERTVALMDQVHGNTVRIVECGGVYPETDGLVTTVPGVFLGVLTADCVPMLVCDPVRGIAGAVHCGWRSIVGGIAERAVGLVSGSLGASPGDIRIALGPSAGPCCYEIGDETAEKLNPGSVVMRNGGMYGNLKAEIRQRLLGCGITGGCIEDISECTICQEEKYFSHRRDGLDSGRMMGFIMIKG